MKRISLILFSILILLIGAALSYEKSPNKNVRFTEKSVVFEELPISVNIYEYILKYSEKYNVPISISLGVARLETSYSGIFHWSYNPAQTSYAAAYGIMQIQEPTASYIWKRNVTKDELLYDYEFNIETSIKYISILYNRYNDWQKALGYYHTGYPIVNWYALNVTQGIKSTDG